MKKCLNILMAAVIPFTWLNAQPEEIPARLSEPFVYRPLTLYRGQLQFNTHFHHITGNTRFDRYGSRLKFDESMSNFLANNFRFELGYGILDFIDFRSAVTLHNEIETDPTYFLLSAGAAGEVNTLNHTTGPGAADLLLRLRQPFFTEGPDMMVFGGVSLPLTSQDPLKPDHDIIRIDPSDPGGTFVMDYLFRPRPAFNTLMFMAGGALKYRSERYAVSLSGSWLVPGRAEETTRWEYRLYGERFRYRPESYQRLPGARINLEGTGAYQPYPWFACLGSFSFYSEYGGWTEETGRRVSLPEVTLGSISPGFEIQVTTNLRFTQFFDFPLFGKEHYALFTVRTTLSINVVPLQNLHY